MKSTTMNLTWEQGRVVEVAVRGTVPRSTVRDSLWVSLMPLARSLDAALEDRLLGFPRRSAAGRTPQAEARTDAASDRESSRRSWGPAVEDLAYGVLGVSSAGVLAYAFWQAVHTMG
jgi:hypothetical protein